MDRGLPPNLAAQVAQVLSNHHLEDVVRTHARDELGIDVDELARPLQAAVVSALCFTSGGLMPLLAAAFVHDQTVRLIAIAGATTLGLLLFGVLGAFLGGAHKFRGAARVVLGGWLALGEEGYPWSGRGGCGGESVSGFLDTAAWGYGEAGGVNGEWRVAGHGAWAMTGACACSRAGSMQGPWSRHAGAHAHSPSVPHMQVWCTASGICWAWRGRHEADPWLQLQEAWRCADRVQGDTSCAPLPGVTAGTHLP